MPELVDVGVTGFLVTDPVAAAAAVRSAYDLDRTACRDRAMLRFSADRMVDDYLALFAGIVAQARP